MATKTISIMDDAYELLVRNKKKDESFTDVIRREFSKKGSILDLAGAWSDLSDNDIEEMENAIKKSREYTRRHVMERIK
ncbi:antitoxin VapB family protein [Candidatus Woesearchaeota archaeon]|nr:antitoxin VapB family protein [Candidatus Woesearchaeota archaeon]